MLELVNIIDKGIQVVFLIATIRPKDEVDFLRVIGLREEEVIILREKTTRRNIEYKVKEYNKKDELIEVKTIVERKLVEHRSGKLIIYYNNIEKGQKMADKVGGKIYNAQIGNEEIKKKVLARVRDGECRV